MANDSTASDDQSGHEENETAERGQWLPWLAWGWVGLLALAALAEVSGWENLRLALDFERHIR